MSDDFSSAAPDLRNETEAWAIVELMGRSRVAGRLSRDTQFGTDLLMIDIPFVDGFVRQFLGATSIFRMTICTEEVARADQVTRDLEPDISLSFLRWQDNELVKSAKETLNPDREPDYLVGPVVGIVTGLSSNGKVVSLSTSRPF
jgi:hypothetical protein